MNLLEKYRLEVEDELRKIVIKGRSPLLGLNSMLAYHLGFCDKDGKNRETAKGKYLRPLFCMAICAGLGGEPSRAVPAAASIELAHRTSLIFDDIQDKGRERNNQPTVWAVWGVDQAINAGFALSSYAHLALQDLRRRDVPNTVTLEIWMVLEKAVLDLCWGQFRDISFGEREVITVDDYLEMVRGKTGALFATACEIGAMIATITYRQRLHQVSPSEGQWYRYIGDRPVADLARDFGMNTGITFQIHDDYLGIWGDEATVGKTANDLIEKKRSLPIVLALQNYPEAVSSFLSRETITTLEANLMKESMETHGIPERMRDIESQYAGVALEKLEALELDPRWHEELAGVLQFVTGRKI